MENVIRVSFTSTNDGVKVYIYHGPLGIKKKKKKPRLSSNGFCPREPPASLIIPILDTVSDTRTWMKSGNKESMRKYIVHN